MDAKSKVQQTVRNSSEHTNLDSSWFFAGLIANAAFIVRAYLQRQPKQIEDTWIELRLTDGTKFLYNRRATFFYSPRDSGECQTRFGELGLHKTTQ